MRRPWGDVIDAIGDLPRRPDTFNPYTDRCEVHDLPDAAGIRRGNLNWYLAAISRRAPGQVWIAEAPGHRGSRRTGVPLVPEPLLAEASRVMGVRPGLSRATSTAPPTVRTARAVWDEIARQERPPVLWNAVLVHPHEPGEPFTNRSPRPVEIRDSAPVVAALLELVRPDVVVAIGRVAEAIVRPHRDDVVYARHPSRGGLSRFRETMAQVRR